MHRWTRRAFVAAGLQSGGRVRGLDRPPLGVPCIARPVRRPTSRPLIVIPGAFGLCLRDQRTGRQIWPGSSAHPLITSNYRSLELDIDPATLHPDS